MGILSRKTQSDTDDSELEDLYAASVTAHSADDPDTETRSILTRSEYEEEGWRCCCKGWRRCCVLVVVIVVLVAMGTGVMAAYLLGLFSRPVVMETGGVLSLDGEWLLRNSDGDIETKAEVPGSVHMALYKAGIIEDPYYRYNDVKLRWVQNKTWIFEKSFNVSEEMQRHSVKLVCEGIDTVASITVNDIHIANVSNQFLRYVLDVNHAIKPGWNNITIEIMSAVKYGAVMYDEMKKKLGYDVPPACPPPEQNPECHANMVRKEQAAFGWDWGPAFVTQGIWKNISLIYFADCHILDLVAQPFQDGEGSQRGVWHVNVSTFVQCGEVGNQTGTLEIRLAGLETKSVKDITVTPGENILNHQMRNLNVDQWWPRGHGNQTLYTLEVNLEAGRSRVYRTVRIGFRTTTLEQPKVQNGLGFHFNINSQPIFMKGSNWVPADSFQDRVDKVRIKQLLQSAVDANMNTIRVWGGGIYEQDYFYDLADEYGLMVWQDFMFACAMYPATEDFLTSVREEVKYQLRRLVSHPSIIVWAANNENEEALVDNRFGTQGSHFKDYLHDYIKLYKGVIEEEVRSLTQVPFLLSSPSNGKITEQQGGVSQHPQPGSPYYGDVHYYNYLDNCLNLSIYPKTRFASEYGWQSWPSYASLSNVSLPDDLKYKSEFFLHREHHTEAGEGTDQLIQRQFPWKNDTDWQKNFKNYIYLTQVVQAMCLQAETEFYRRARSDPNVDTMGALYWQLNEIWQAPSWSTLEYDGKWKMAHYAARHSFSDVFLSTYMEKDILMGYVINDSPDDVQGYRVDFQVSTWERVIWTDEVILDEEKIFKAGTVTQVLHYNVSQYLDVQEPLPSLASGFISVSIEFYQPKYQSGHSQFLVPFKEAQGLKDPNIELVSVTEKGNNTFTIEFWSDNVGVFIWLDAGDIKGRFSENGFTGQFYDRKVDFYAWEDGVTCRQLKDSITITSLWDALS